MNSVIESKKIRWKTQSTLKSKIPNYLVPFSFAIHPILVLLSLFEVIRHLFLFYIFS